MGLWLVSYAPNLSKSYIKASIITAASVFLNFFLCVILEKIKLDISYESAAKRTIHMKCQVLFSFTNNINNKNRMSSATILLGALRRRILLLRIERINSLGIAQPCETF